MVRFVWLRLVQVERFCAAPAFGAFYKLWIAVVACPVLFHVAPLLDIYFELIYVLDRFWFLMVPNFELPTINFYRKHKIDNFHVDIVFMPFLKNLPTNKVVCLGGDCHDISNNPTWTNLRFISWSSSDFSWNA